MPPRRSHKVLALLRKTCRRRMNRGGRNRLQRAARRTSPRGWDCTAPRRRSFTIFPHDLPPPHGSLSPRTAFGRSRWTSRPRWPTPPQRAATARTAAQRRPGSCVRRAASPAASAAATIRSGPKDGLARARTLHNRPFSHAPYPSRLQEPEPHRRHGRGEALDSPPQEANARGREPRFLER